MSELYSTGKETAEDFLEHYGILGMKWGVRNAETRERYTRKGNNKPDSVKRAKGNSGGNIGKSRSQKNKPVRAAQKEFLTRRPGETRRVSSHKQAKEINQALEKRTSGKVAKRFGEAADKNQAYIDKVKARKAVKDNKKEAKAEDKRKKDVHSYARKIDNKAIDIHNTAAKIMKDRNLKEFNKSWSEKGANLHDPSKKKINREYTDAYNKFLVNAQNEALRKMGLDKDPKTGATYTFIYKPNAAPGEIEFYFNPKPKSINHSGEDVLDELYHYGVMGMKWGVRRTQAQLDRASGRKPRTGLAPKGSPRYNSRVANPYNNTILGKTPKNKRRVEKMKAADKAKIPKLEKKLATQKEALDKKLNPTKGMSDQALREQLNRMNMEKQYSQLSKGEKSTGRKIAETIFIGGATVVATEYFKEHLKYLADPLLKVGK